MMKKILLSLLVIVLITAGIGFVYRSEIGMALTFMALKPEATFNQATPPAAPDYRNPNHWAALPNREDDADVSPQGTDLDKQASAPVDVFFIHPTTYYKADAWNQPLDDVDANTFTDEQVMRNQASVFNSCCRIYAPRYRQATLYSFMDEGPDGEAAIDFAYTDVKKAFEYYLEHYNDGRPFIIAGHSQGGKHGDTLLKEVAKSPLAQKLVAAYPVGYYFDGAGSVPVCEHATQTGCQVTWNSVAPDAPKFQSTTGSICVNPLSWSTDGERADFAANLGAVSFNETAEIEPGVADAQCVDGVLLVSEVRSEKYSGQMFGPGNYHVYDFNFFHMNIRANVEARVAAFLNP